MAIRTSQRTSSLNLVIRFTASIPDLSLTISDPSQTTTLSLKRQIRTHLLDPISTHRLRLIYAGKVLRDLSTLQDGLRLSSIAPPPRSYPRAAEDVAKGKGKAPATEPLLSESQHPSHLQLYMNCSVGDPLTASELASEAAAAEATEIGEAVSPTYSSLSAQQPTPSTIPQPIGFDRLLTAGFTPAEITALRAQFLALQQESHTPDTLPTAAELRLLEDRWIDESAGLGIGGLGDGFGEGGTMTDAGVSGYGDVLWGNVMGFFWPLGAVVWLLREQGLWNGRTQMAVFTGMMVNVAFSVLRYSTT
ncbi:MAG: hypothetical protein M1817_002643 [Caeruleum heppii]|nr:MAG: hypothetical protein M1817_002643 [Caeruleum heppii]